MRTFTGTSTIPTCFSARTAESTKDPGRPPKASPKRPPTGCRWRKSTASSSNSAVSVTNGRLCGGYIFPRKMAGAGRSAYLFGKTNWCRKPCVPVLEAYYEPQFSDLSHGFRPNRGCHSVLLEIAGWQGIDWFIEGDIKACFDSIDHSLLLSILNRENSGRPVHWLTRPAAQGRIRRVWQARANPGRHAPRRPCQSDPSKHLPR